MQAEAKTVWVEALRSDRYKQIQGTLHIPAYKMPKGQEGHCALGVLAQEWAGEVTALQSYEYNELFPKLGLSEAEQDAVWRMNDRDDKSFSEIADWVEENL